MEEFASVQLKPETLERLGRPDRLYPVPAEGLKRIAQHDELFAHLMLHGLQLASRSGVADWLANEAAMEKLLDLLTPPDERKTLSGEGEEWFLECGPIDLKHAELVSIQRDTQLLAAITDSGKGYLRAAAYRPLDAKSIRYLLGLARKPHPVHGVSMGRSPWEYALDASHGMGNFYACDRGEAYLSYWARGLGNSNDGSIIPEWGAQIGLPARPAARVLMELGIYHMFSEVSS